MHRKGSVAIIVLLVVLAIFAWGFIGGMESSSVGVSCDIGLGDNLCWKWHTNAIGQVQEYFEDMSDNN